MKGYLNEGLKGGNRVSRCLETLLIIGEDEDVSELEVVRCNAENIRIKNMSIFCVYGTQCGNKSKLIEEKNFKRKPCIEHP